MMYDQDNLKQALLSTAKGLVDDNVIMGKPIVAGDTTVVPVFKASVGMIGGGSQTAFAGSGAGLTVAPVTFIVISGGTVKLLSAGDNTQLERLLDAAPALIDRVLSVFETGEEGEER